MLCTGKIHIGDTRRRELRLWYFGRDWGRSMRDFVGMTRQLFRLLLQGGNQLSSLTTSWFYLSQVKYLLNRKVMLVEQDTLGFFTQLNNNKHIFPLVKYHRHSFDLVFNFVGSPVKYMFWIVCYDYNRRIDINSRFRSHCHPNFLQYKLKFDVLFSIKLKLQVQFQLQL